MKNEKSDATPHLTVPDARNATTEAVGGGEGGGGVEHRRIYKSLLNIANDKGALVNLRCEKKNNVKNKRQDTPA